MRVERILLSVRFVEFKKGHSRNEEKGKETLSDKMIDAWDKRNSLDKRRKAPKYSRREPRKKT